MHAVDEMLGPSSAVAGQPASVVASTSDTAAASAGRPAGGPTANGGGPVAGPPTGAASEAVRCSTLVMLAVVAPAALLLLP